MRKMNVILRAMHELLFKQCVSSDVEEQMFVLWQSRNRDKDTWPIGSVVSDRFVGMMAEVLRWRTIFVGFKFDRSLYDLI